MAIDLKKDRLEKQSVFESIVGKGHVYFQPGDMSKMKLPYLVFNRIPADRAHANNEVFIFRQKYDGTYVTTNPDDKIIEQLQMLPHFKLTRSFKLDGAYNYNFNYY